MLTLILKHPKPLGSFRITCLDHQTLTYRIAPFRNLILVLKQYPPRCLIAKRILTYRLFFFLFSVNSKTISTNVRQSSEAPVLQRQSAVDLEAANRPKSLRQTAKVRETQQQPNQNSEQVKPSSAVDTSGGMCRSGH